MASEDQVERAAAAEESRPAFSEEQQPADEEKASNDASPAAGETAVAETRPPADTAVEAKETATPGQEMGGSETSGAPWAAAEKRLLELLPDVKDESILQVLADLPDSAALVSLVQKGKPPPKVNFGPRGSLKSTGTSLFAANEPSSMKKAHESQFAAKALSKNLGTVDSKSLAVGGAGAGGGLGLNRPGFGPKVTHFAGRGSISGAKSIDIDEGTRVAWSEMMDDKSSTGWVLAAYSADGKNLELQNKGEGGLGAFKEQLGDQIAWGGFRCYGVDKRGGLECKRPKFIFVQYKPEAASAIKKAKTASHKGDVKDAFPGAHIDVVVEKLEDLDEAGLITKLQAATGAHKPNGYEFEEGKFFEADYYGLGIGKSCKGESSKSP